MQSTTGKMATKLGKKPLPFEQKLKQLEKMSMFTLNIRLIRFWGHLFEYNWRTVLSLFLMTMLNVFELTHLMRELSAKRFVANIQTLYLTVVWICGNMRVWFLSMQRRRYEHFLLTIVDLNQEIMQGEIYIIEILQKYQRLGALVSYSTILTSGICVFGFILHPLFQSKKELPFSIYIPGIDIMETPIFEILYLWQGLLGIMGCCVCVSNFCLIISLILFPIAMCKILQYRLRQLSNLTPYSNILTQELNWCIKYQMKIVSYTNTTNNLTSISLLLEFLLFTGILCAVLFMLNMSRTYAEICIASLQIGFVLLQLIVLYYFAHELSIASYQVAESAFHLNWYDFPLPLQRHIQLIIMRAKKPCCIRLGNLYPMNLELFQSLLNTSFYYFNVLKQFNT